MHVSGCRTSLMEDAMLESCSYVEYYSDYSVHISSLPLGAKDKYYDTNKKNSPISLSRPSFSCTHDGASLTAKTRPGKAANMTLCLEEYCDDYFPFCTLSHRPSTTF